MLLPGQLKEYDHLIHGVAARFPDVDAKQVCERVFQRWHDEDVREAEIIRLMMPEVIRVWMSRG